MADSTSQSPTSPLDEAKQLVSAVDNKTVSLTDLSDEGQLTYAIAKGQVDPSTLNDEGKAIFESLQTHPIKAAISNVAHPVMEVGNQIVGGMGGAAAGEMVGAPAQGAAIGAGLGKLKGKLQADAVDLMMGYSNPKYPLMNETDPRGMLKTVATGAGEQIVGDKVIGPVLGKILEGGGYVAKKLAPTVMNFLSDLPKPIAEKVVNNPSLPKEFSGTNDSIESAIGGVQKALMAFKEKASAMYDEAKAAAGIAVPKTGEEAAAAIKSGGLKVRAPAAIADDFQKLMLAAKQGAISETDALQVASTLKQEINQHLNFYEFGQKTAPVSSKTEALLNPIKTDLVNMIKQLPNGDKLIEADRNWSTMKQVYNLLQPEFENAGSGAEFAKKVFADEGTKLEHVRDAFNVLDSITGTNAGEKLSNEVASNAANQAFPDHVLAKRQVLLGLALLSPGKLATIPGLLLGQSPRVLAGAYGMASRAATAVATNPAVVGGGVASILGDKALSSMGGK